jgi:hypothetical protein
MREVSALQRRVNHLFSELMRWQQCVCAHEAHVDQLALITLKIVSTLFDNYLGETIGKELSLINASTRENIGEDLLESFKLIEEDLEGNLRGFSALMEWIMEEGEIRKDTAFLLKRVPEQSQHALDSVNQLARTLTVYLDLAEAFSLEATKAPVLLFLLGLSSVYADLKESSIKDAQRTIALWVKARMRNKDIFRLLKKSFAVPSLLSADNVAIEISKELLLVLICYKSANEGAITSKEAGQLDRMLISVGMLGLKPLLDAGLLTLESDQELCVLPSDNGKILRLV